MYALDLFQAEEVMQNVGHGFGLRLASGVVFADDGYGRLIGSHATAFNALMFCLDGSAE